jgi:MerR family transcriptional regulator/heat shock protein HspR
MRYFKLHHVCRELAVDDDLLDLLAAEGLLHVETKASAGPMLSAEEAEKLRVITVLMREMEVNLAGVEVILHMREEMRGMRRQFDEILHVLVRELRRRVRP